MGKYDGPRCYECPDSKPVADGNGVTWLCKNAAKKRLKDEARTEKEKAFIIGEILFKKAQLHKSLKDLSTTAPKLCPRRNLDIMRYIDDDPKEADEEM